VAGVSPRPADGLPDDRSGTASGAGSVRYRGTSYRATNGPPVVPAYPSRADFHTHSCRSDGVLEPDDLIRAAAAAGIRVMALSDHDSLAGVRELCAPGAPELPLELLAGVEINSVATGIDGLWEGELHILGLGVDQDDEAFEAALVRQRDARAIRFRRIVDRLRDLGLPVDAQAETLVTEPGASLGRPQIARLLVAAGHRSSVDEAMQTLLARGRPAYVERQGLGPAEAIAAIRAAGGLPVLAHFSDAADRLDLIRDLIRAGLGGLEVHYRKFDADTVAELAAVATDLRLVPTGGSDYHGDVETYAEAHRSLFVPDEDAAAVYRSLGRALTLEGAIS